MLFADRRQTIGSVNEADDAIVRAAMAAAAAGFAAWAATPLDERAAALERAADRLERNRGRLIALLQNEAGKTLDDALASCARQSIIAAITRRRRAPRLSPQPMPGPTGESNVLRYRGRGVFVCISPWNFPLAIFIGQVSAALAAGNSVVAKPAEQTPLIAALAVALLHDAGVPKTALHFVPGDGDGRRQPCRRSACRRRGFHRLDRSRPRHQPRARRQSPARSCR